MTAYCVMDFFAQGDIKYFQSPENAKAYAAKINGFAMQLDELTPKEYLSLNFEDARNGILEA